MTSVAPVVPAVEVPALRDAVAKLAEQIGKLGGQVGVSVVEVGSGRVLASHEASKALNPASNAKVATAAAALARLGPQHRFVTAIHGKVKGGAAGTVALRGSGDPSLTTADLGALAAELKAAGVRRIDGDLLVDQGFFDDNFVPPAFEQQPNEWAWFRAPVSAVALNGNTITMHVRPGDEGEAAVVWFDPPGFVDVEGAVRTVDGGAAQNVTLALEPAGKRLLARVGGGIPATARPLSFVRRVDDPALLAGHALKAALAEKGITLKGEVKAGGEKGKSPAIAQHQSKPLGVLVQELGKQSDNFVAEMIFKALALEAKGRPARAADGAAVVEAFLKEIGVMEDGMVVRNGSGLFDANRSTASSMTKLLRHAYRDPAYGSEFVAQLAVGGRDGTLRGRFRKGKAAGVVRAKTGTLEAVVALSGYVMGPAGRDPLAFSIMVNGVAGKARESREAIDRCVEALARHQWP